VVMVAMSVVMPVAVMMAVMMVVIVVVVVAHVSIPLMGSAMCSNMVASRVLMWASAAA
jgi:hypothetical protein